jgi:uncharacterized protein YukE
VLVDGSDAGSMFTPPPGSPSTVRAAANQLCALAERSEAVAHTVGRGKDEALESWSGEAADNFTGYAHALVTLAEASSEPLRSIRRAVHRYADALGTAQRRIEDAAARHEAALAAAEWIDAQHAAAAEAEHDAQAAWEAYESECVAVAGDLHRIAQGVVTATSNNRVTTVLSTEARVASGQGVGGPEPGAANWPAVQFTLLDLQAMRGNAFGWVGYLKRYQPGAGSMIQQGRAWAASDDIWRMAQRTFEGSNWDELVRGAMATEDQTPAMSRLSQVGHVGKALGPAGVLLGGFQTYQEFAQGNETRGYYDGSITALGMAALATPPPVSLVCGAAAAAMVGGQLLYDNVPAVKDFVEGGLDTIENIGGGIANAANTGWGAVGDVF